MDEPPILRTHQVDATSGICAWYNGKIAQTFYYASNGGATEDCANVWFADLPYLKGKPDPYEADIASTVSGTTGLKPILPAN